MQCWMRTKCAKHSVDISIRLMSSWYIENGGNQWKDTLTHMQVTDTQSALGQVASFFMFLWSHNEKLYDNDMMVLKLISNNKLMITTSHMVYHHVMFTSIIPTQLLHFLFIHFQRNEQRILLLMFENHISSIF